LWHNGKPRHEHSAQRLFFAVADSYCKANNLDVTPEAETGRGPVDFKFSAGYRTRLVVEVKLSTNSKLVSGYRKQLEIYKNAELTARGLYLVIDVGDLGRKATKLMNVRNDLISRGQTSSRIEFVDGAIKPSASVSR
jgi:hypothetical protein